MVANRRLMFFGVAILLSAGTIVLAQQWLQGQASRAAAFARVQAARSEVKSVQQVLVARRALPAGAILKADDLRWQAWPGDVASPDYMTPAQTSLAKAAGAVTRAPIAAGEPLTADNLARPGDRGFLAAVLAPGFRAVTLNVSPSTGVAGFVLPGDRVDLVLTRGLDAGQGNPRRFVSETIARDIRVVGSDQRLNHPGPKDPAVMPQTVTLEVTPRQAELLALAGERGRLSLSLRSLAQGPEDARPLLTLTDESDLLAPRPPAPKGARRKVRPDAPRPQVVVVRGVKASPAG